MDGAVLYRRKGEIRFRTVTLVVADETLKPEARAGWFQRAVALCSWEDDDVTKGRFHASRHLRQGRAPPHRGCRNEILARSKSFWLARRQQQYTTNAPNPSSQYSKMSSEKKRKRQEQGGERPSKKAAIAPAQGNVKVEYIDNDEMLGPIVGMLLAVLGFMTIQLTILQHQHQDSGFPHR